MTQSSVPSRLVRQWRAAFSSAAEPFWKTQTLASLAVGNPDLHKCLLGNIHEFDLACAHEDAPGISTAGTSLLAA
jgi:hypothetical protein